jgi:selenocysteine lyase/cysteine desulfurase
LHAAVQSLPGCRCLTPVAPEQRAGIVSLALEGDVRPDLKEALFERHGVIVAYWHPRRLLRLSVACFSVLADLDRTLEAIEDCLRHPGQP